MQALALDAALVQANAPLVPSLKRKVPRGFKAYTPLGGERVSKRGPFFALAKRFFAVFASIIVLVLLCALASVAIVCPLWAFAMRAPVVYTAVCLAAFAVWLVFCFLRHRNHNHK